MCICEVVNDQQLESPFVSLGSFPPFLLMSFATALRFAVACVVSSLLQRCTTVERCSVIDDSQSSSCSVQYSGLSTLVSIS